MLGLFNKRKAGTVIEKNKILSEQSKGVAKEAYKTLRANIMLSMPGDESKVIGVTSAFAGDGKTLNVINLACSFAEFDKKVLVVDANLRNPVVHGALGFELAPGLSELIEGKEEIDSVINYDQDKHLHVLTAGSVAKDSTCILQSEEMRALIKELRTRYDYVFIDLPATEQIIDAVLLAREIDGYLVVVKERTTKRKDVDRMIETIENVNGKIIGMIYNMSEAAGRKKQIAGQN